MTGANKQSCDFLFESAELKSELGDISLTEPEVLTFLRGTIEEGVNAAALQAVPA